VIGPARTGQARRWSQLTNASASVVFLSFRGEFVEFVLGGVFHNSSLPTIEDGDNSNDCTNGETVETNAANDAGCVATAT
jgi:hypothetical protein